MVSTPSDTSYVKGSTPLKFGAGRYPNVPVASKVTVPCSGPIRTGALGAPGLGAEVPEPSTPSVKTRIVDPECWPETYVQRPGFTAAPHADVRAPPRATRRRNRPPAISSA